MKKYQKGGQGYNWNDPIWQMMPSNLFSNIQSLYNNYNTSVKNQINNSASQSANTVPDLSYYEDRYRSFYNNKDKNNILSNNITEEDIKRKAEAARQRDIEKAASSYNGQLDSHNQLMNSGLLQAAAGLYSGQRGYMNYLSREKEDLTPEQGFHGFKHGGYVNKTGYTPGYSSMNNPFNIIPNNQITMRNTPFSVLGIPDKGLPRMMHPGNDYKFPGARYVTEIPAYQEGGEMELIEPMPAQTEKGEYIGLMDGTISPVKAKKKHKNMSDEEVTDLLPPNAFVFSKDPKMTIDKNKKFKGLNLNDIILGYTPTDYSETEDFSGPKEIKALDFMNKNKFTPADLAAKLKSTYKVTDRENDAFATHAAAEARESRIPYLELIKAFNESKRKGGIQKFQYGGYSESPIRPKLMEIHDVNYRVDKDTTINNGLSTNKILSEKGDPYEYKQDNDGKWKTRKKGSESWRDLNTAGIVEVEKRLLSGRYDNKSKQSTVSPARKKTIDPKSVDEVASKKMSYNWQTDFPIKPPMDDKRSYQYTVTDSNLSAGPDPVGFNEAIFVGASGLSAMLPGTAAYNRIPLRNTVNSVLNNAWKNYNPLRDPSMVGRFAYRYGGYNDAYHNRDKALRNNGIQTLPQVGLKSNFFPMKFQGGGGNQKGGANLGLLGGLVGSITDIISGIKAEDLRQDYYEQSVSDLNKYVDRAKTRLGQIGNQSAAFNVASYATQDPSYTYLDLSNQRAASDSSFARQLNANQNNRNLAFASGQAPITSFMRNASSLGLSPSQSANLAARMQAQGLNNANQTGLRYNEMENNILRNQLSSDMNIYDRLSADRQFGRASIRNNINNLNAGLMGNMKNDSIGYLKSMDDLDRFDVSTDMALRNQNMAAMVGNTFALGDSINQGFNSYAAYQDARRSPQYNYNPPRYGGNDPNWVNRGQSYYQYGNNNQYNPYLEIVDPYQFNTPTGDYSQIPRDPLFR